MILEPKDNERDAVVLEFKVRNPDREKSLEETARNALAQIAAKKYDTELLARGIPEIRIRHYGFAFEGKKVLIRQAADSEIVQN